jgi:glycosyltransferase involved in cell wall biosynthesis
MSLDSQRPRVMFTYWGRRGFLSRFSLEVGRAALALRGAAVILSISRQNESFSKYSEFEEALFPVDTFDSDIGAILQVWRVPFLRRQLVERVRQEKIQAVIELMPHVWSPLVMPAVQAAGVRYCSIVHDADPHVGDKTRFVHPLLERASMSADLIFTLSSSVFDRLLAKRPAAASRLRLLLLPNLTYGKLADRRPPQPGEPLRLLFLGRIMPYKGLPLFLDTVDLLRESGIPVQVGVFGEGPLGPDAERLRAIGAEVCNRWLSEDEIGAALARYHAVVLSHVEASQSGVAAAAFGAGMPVVATPVGGLIEQVTDGVTGSLAQTIDAPALAEATKRLLLNQEVYRATCGNILTLGKQRSMARFVDTMIQQALQP